jgi:hypothetical protein
MPESNSGFLPQFDFAQVRNDKQKSGQRNDDVKEIE